MCWASPARDIAKLVLIRLGQCSFLELDFQVELGLSCVYYSAIHICSRSRCSILAHHFHYKNTPKILETVLDSNFKVESI
jgi:hypothetical protein